jgi:hypothetical protein
MSAMVKAQDSDAAPTDAPAPKRTALGEPTDGSGVLIMSSLILILGLTVVGVVWRVTRKRAAARRYQIFTDDSSYNQDDDLEFYRQLRQGFAIENHSLRGSASRRWNGCTGGHPAPRRDKDSRCGSRPYSKSWLL